MSLLTVENLSHTFGDRILFKEVSFRLLAGERVGLVGANGAGKSTLMNILTGKQLKDEGRVEWTPKIRYGYLDQHTKLQAGKTIRDVLRDAFAPLLVLEQELSEVTAAMAEPDADLDALLERMGEIQEELEIGDYYMLDVKVEEMANGLGLNAIGLDRDVTALSGGQRTKVLLAKLLLEKPTVLLLDEPTNYLDEEHITWLAGYLRNYPNAFLLISHDTGFMNSVVSVIYHLEFARLTRYTGNYEKFLEMAELNKAQHLGAYEKQQDFIKKQEDFIQRNKARASTSGRAKSREKQLDRIDRIDKPEEAAKPTFKFNEGRTSGKTIFEAKGLRIGYTKQLVPEMDMLIERGDKIAIVGCNGVGKSTLLKTILGRIEPLGGEVYRGDYLLPAYFEQEAKAPTMTPLDDVWNEFSGMNQHEVRAALARCGLKNEHITRALNQLSGGEQAKVRLCKLMLRESNWILFDEPTNHLDVVAKAELKRALEAYRGTVVLVSHEPDFYESWVTKTWDVESWSLKQAQSQN
ncbi:ABC-F family ATP-binding cassette domain-containing protein [Paenibacillus albicereus]|uniref:ABC-F family ATP-binding cassette domain-containing protein n=1 Tax=Paenibacillus albicereus TaxID=2726185 RepID=A0A6H2GY20_9BACL|nr:ABC-F family ATP-binding cassette domain-containing protein [Paenibacillus albicereus]QJC52028.1 ABC-F family ATP-binding cassette domain-containing protein [Paenibacillus albicereus]